ncbi:MAG: hypothetical protein LBF97_03960, partial [Elusimicrobiota bacterium]|nr:hypothetical protein [Elusimicrobiota bacterium]
MLVKQKVALKNANRSYSFEVVQLNLISQTFNKTIFYLENKIAAIDKELDILLDTDNFLKQNFHKLISIVGFGKLLSLHFLVITNNCQNLNYKKLSAFLGICPY